MKEKFSSLSITTGLAIFSMLFGAGNMIFPLMAGMQAGDQTGIAMMGFFLTAVFLPVAGLIGMILFDGNYEQFFGRVGKIPGNIIIVICMIIIGPLLAVPRITALSHIMIAPFIPWNFLQNINLESSFVFSLIFLGITFLTTYRKNKIIEILGNVISPLLLCSLGIIIVKGLITPGHITHINIPPLKIFTTFLIRGYETLDLLSALFFASIILRIVKKNLDPELPNKTRRLAWIGLKSGLIGTTLLGIVYIGISSLGAYHGYGFENENAGELFREISFRVLGNYGTAVIAIAVLMACLSTAIALVAAVTNYVQYTIFNKTISFASCLFLVLITCLPLATAGLSQVLKITAGPITFIGYPVLITITFCNIAYKIFDFKPIKMPVLIVFVSALLSYFIV